MSGQYSAPRYYEIAFDTDRWQEVSLLGNPSGRRREAILTWFAA